MGDFAQKVSDLENVIRSCGDVGAWERYVTPYWRKSVKCMYKDFDPLPDDFLRHSIVLEAFFVNGNDNWFQPQRRWVEERATPEEIALIAEDDFGAPLIRDTEWRTSHQMIHTLYHLLRYRESTGVGVAGLVRSGRPLVVVEWGGGYGAMAKLLWRFACLYGVRLILVEIDLPFMVTLQRTYLKEVFRDAEPSLVAVVPHPKISISTEEWLRDMISTSTPGVYFVPLGMEWPAIKADLFLSTWALSESTLAAQRLVGEDLRWFGAEHLLLGFQSPNEVFPLSTAFGGFIPEGSRIEPLKHGPPENFYLFK